MFPIFILFFLLAVAFGAVTTTPFSVSLLVVSIIIFKKSWVFFAALAIGLLLDLVNIRPLGYTSLAFTIFVFLIRLYERKFETQTFAFVFIATFLGSLAYLFVFHYPSVFLESFTAALLSVLLFRFCHPELVSGSRLDQDAETPLRRSSRFAREARRVNSA